MREADILYERGNYWVALVKGAHVVYRNSGQAAWPDSSYTGDTDGLSLAKARVDYLDRAHPARTKP